MGGKRVLPFLSVVSSDSGCARMEPVMRDFELGVAASVGLAVLAAASALSAAGVALVE